MKKSAVVRRFIRKLTIKRGKTNVMNGRTKPRKHSLRVPRLAQDVIYVFETLGMPLRKTLLVWDECDASGKAA
ncbi:MAG: hypothetical protein DWH78_02070 [Planctomycetota bacterium]|nr:MAG: hypothetical protein DWH78_02070 [Planctomycetota bacterium]